MTYLADTSAIVRMLRGQAASHWYEQAERGLVSICEPVLVETLTLADAKSYQQVEKDLLTMYPWVPVPDDAWDLVRNTRRALAARSQHQGLSVADHLVVATALRHRLTVLHEDADFQTVARVVPDLREERLSSRPVGASEVR